MNDTAPIDLCRQGGVLAVADGPELLVYDASGQPLWKQFCDHLIADVSASPADIVVLDTEGVLRRLRAIDGVELDRATVGHFAGVDRSSSGVILTWDRSDVVVQAQWGAPVVRLGVAGANAAALGPDGASVAVCTGSQLTVVDPTTGLAWGTSALPGEATAVAWSALGFWVVSAGHSVCIVSGDGTEVQAAIPGATARLGDLAVSDSGVIAAVCHGLNSVMVVELHGRAAVGQVDFRREVSQVSFGRGSLLGIGLDDGDVTLLDVSTGGSARTEPHPGRGRNNWNLEDRLERERIRGAMAYSAAGGAPIAKYEGPPPEKGSWWLTCLGVFLVVSLMCAGCSGLAGAYWYFFT